MGESLSLSSSYVIPKGQYACYDCKQPVEGYLVPAFLLFLNYPSVPKKGLNGLQCQSCGAIVSTTCETSPTKKKKVEDLDSTPCPNCGKPFGPAAAILSSSMAVRAAPALSKIWANLRRGRIRQKLTQPMDIIGSLLFAFVVGVIGVDLIDRGGPAAMAVGLLAFPTALLQLVHLSWYLFFFPPSMQVVSALSDITFGVGSLLMMANNVEIIFPIGFILIPVGLWRLIKYPRFKQSVLLLQAEVEKLDGHRH